MKKHYLFRRRASSLVISLMVVAVLTIIVVAFLQSMAIERKTAGSYSNMLKARLAAEGALQQAIQRIQSTFPTNSAALTNGVVVWTWGKDTNFNTSYTGILTNIFDTSGSYQGVDRTVWLFSTTNSTVAPDTISTSTNDIYNVNADKRVNASTASIPVDWVTLATVTNSSGATNFSVRSAYWVSDEAGRLPVTEVGNSTNGTTASGKISDIKLLAVTNSEVAALLTNRAILSTLGGISYREVAPSTTNSPSSFSSISRSLSGRINYGGYAMQPRTNINSLVASNASDAGAFITQFKDLVTRGLPFYAARKTTTNGNLERIAASIFDYIDTNNTPTMSSNLVSKFTDLDNIEDAAGWPDYTDGRSFYGIEAVPRINEYLCYYGDASEAVTKFSVDSSEIKVGVTRQLEVWNLSQRPILVSGVTLRVFNHQTVSIFGGNEIPSSDETLVDFTPASATIPANGFVVFKHSKVYSSPKGTSTIASFGDFRALLPDWSGMGLILKATVDGATMVTDGFFPADLQGTPSSGKAGNNPGYSTSGNTTDIRVNLGRFLSKWSDNTGTAHTPGQPNNSSGRPYQDLTTWFDRPQVGGNLSVSPLSPPAYIKNAPMEYIGELGNIFDPNKDMQEGAGRPRGGKTLVIGQFDPFFRVQDGVDSSGNRDYTAYLKRADSALLDLFTANDLARVNINSPRPKTEPDRPLAFLGNSIEMSTTNIFPQAATPTFSSTGFEDAVINRLATPSWRTARPFRNMNDLTTLNSSLAANPFVIGSTNFWSAASSKLWKANAPSSVTVTPYGPLTLPAINLPNADDRSREEAMRRVANFVDFSSLAFRIYTAGQVRGPNGKVQARADLQAVVTFTPQITKDPSTGTTLSVQYVPSVRLISIE